MGEGEEFLNPENERRSRRRDCVSRAQWFRYMAMHRGNNWRDHHWLWFWGIIAQLYTITYCNRMEAQKVQYMKRLQGRYRLSRSRALIEYLEKIRENRGNLTLINSLKIFNL